MKKQYHKPTSEFIEVRIKTSLLVGTIEITDEEKGGDDALSSEHRSEWE